jgi:hypothetical protein
MELKREEEIAQARLRRDYRLEEGDDRRAPLVSGRERGPVYRFGRESEMGRGRFLV